MCEPISIGAILAGVGSAFKFADLAVRIAEVASENEVFVRTIHVVRDDLNEVQRLLNTESVQRKLASTPTKLPWVGSAINNTKSALDEIGIWVERARAEQQSTGSIQFNTRVRWVFSDHEKLLNRKTELMTCHQQLSNVLSYLIRLEEIPITNEPPTYQDTTYFDDILQRHKRKGVGKAPENAPPHKGLSNAKNTSRAAHAHDYLLLDTEATRSSALDGPYDLRTANSDFGHQANVPESSLCMAPEAFPPCSPPPTYASAVQSDPRGEQSKSDEKRRFESNDVTHKTHVSSASNIGSTPFFPEQSNSKGIWAYQHTHNNTSAQELAGDTVSFSATNSFGPVNPYDYCTGSELSVPKAPQKSGKTKDVAELLGDLNFAVELPSDDPGPPPGYPPRSSKHMTYGSVGVKSVDQARIHGQRMSVPELPDITRRRPVPEHTVSEPISMAYELPPTSAYNKPVESSSEQNVVVYEEFLSSVHGQRSGPHPSPSIELPTLVHPSYSSLYLGSTGSTTESSMRSNPQYQQRGIHTQTAARPNSVDGRSMPLSSQAPTESVTYTRMRRQKQMMDMLGSIGS